MPVVWAAPLPWIWNVCRAASYAMPAHRQRAKREWFRAVGGYRSVSLRRSTRYAETGHLPPATRHVCAGDRHNHCRTYPACPGTPHRSSSGMCSCNDVHIGSLPTDLRMATGNIEGQLQALAWLRSERVAGRVWLSAALRDASSQSAFRGTTDALRSVRAAARNPGALNTDCSQRKDRGARFCHLLHPCVRADHCSAIL